MLCGEILLRNSYKDIVKLEDTCDMSNFNYLVNDVYTS